MEKQDSCPCELSVFNQLKFIEDWKSVFKIDTWEHVGFCSFLTENPEAFFIQVFYTDTINRVGIPWKIATAQNRLTERISFHGLKCRTDLDIGNTLVIQNDLAFGDNNLDVLLLTISQKIDFSIIHTERTDYGIGDIFHKLLAVWKTENFSIVSDTNIHPAHFGIGKTANLFQELSAVPWFLEFYVLIFFIVYSHFSFTISYL